MRYKIVKRCLDLVFTTIALVLLFPVFLITIIGIKVSSKGPALFKANRIGLNGKEFVMYKFRSMHVNYEKEHIITLRTDDRIFPFGKFIRMSKIDELPQLINVFKGDMSIVGWRPEDKENVGKVFSGKYKEILRIKPGLTSPGSLYDYTHGELYDNEKIYEEEFLPKKMDLERYYVDHQSLLYDVELVIRTIITILKVIIGKRVFSDPPEIKIIGK